MTFQPQSQALTVKQELKMSCFIDFGISLVVLSFKQEFASFIYLLEYYIFNEPNMCQNLLGTIKERVW